MDNVELEEGMPLSFATIISIKPQINDMPDYSTLKVDKSPTSLDHILQTIVTTEMHLKHLEMNPVTLEDVFLSLTGNELRD